MTKPQDIQVAFLPSGDIEAALWRPISHTTHRVVIDRRTGSVLESNVCVGSDMFRWLVMAGRKHVAR